MILSSTTNARGKVTAGMGWTAKRGSTAPPERDESGGALSFPDFVSPEETRADPSTPVDSGGNGLDQGNSERAIEREAEREAERELIRRLVAGESAAMTEFVARYGPMLRRLIGRLCAWSADVDDLMQEVLLRAWERAGSYRGGSLAAWLRAIAIRHCRNHFRGLGAWRRMLDRFRGYVQTDSRRPSDDHREQSDWIRHALQQLSSADRTILVLYYLEELPLEELAETLNARSGTLAVRLHRARERLKRLLERPMDPEVEQ